MGQLLQNASLRNIFSSIARGRIGGSSDKSIEGVVCGDGYSTRKAGNSPFQYLPDSEATRRRTFIYHWWMGDELATANSTTDGSGANMFVNTNSATFTATSTQAGYQGGGILTTGGASGNHAGFIGCPGFLDVTNQLAVCFCSLYFPDPNAAAWDLFFGFSNKTIAPGTSGTYPTDGAYWKGVTAAGILPIKGITSSNAANTDNDAQATRTVSAAPISFGGGSGGVGTAQSVELAVVLKGQASAEFWWRMPGTAANGWNNNGTNDATAPVINTLTMPRNSIVLRPHLLPVTRTAATAAFQIKEMAFWWFTPPTW